MKRILIGALVVLVIAGGIVAGRVRARPYVRTSLTALTITSKITDYGIDGAVVGVYTKIRKQYSDGSWKNRVEIPGHPTRESSGRIDLSDVPSTEVYAEKALARGNTVETYLGYTVYVQRDPNGTEFWYCPELDSMLKEVEHSRKDGKLESITETLSIRLGQPEN
jgi:hypothetical protein